MVSTMFETKPTQAVDVSLATLKLPRQNINANTNPVGELAMSVAQADAVLAKYGYLDAVSVAA